MQIRDLMRLDWIPKGFWSGRFLLTKTADAETTGVRRPMLKSTYAKLDEIPDGDRQHYTKRGDRYVLELDGEHPVQAQVATLTQEKKDEVHKASQRAATAETEVQTLKTQMANNPTLPSGHVAVPADKAQLLDAIEELGEGADTKAKVENVKTRLIEHATLATENATMKKTELLRQVADAGIGGKKLKASVLQTLDSQAGGLTWEERDVTVDGKSQKAWHVKDGNKWVSLQEYSDAHWKDFSASLIADGSPGVKVPRQTADDKSKGGESVFDAIRKEAAEKQKQNQVTNIPLEQRLNMTV